MGEKSVRFFENVRPQFKIALLVAGLLCVAAFLFVDIVPPRSSTDLRMIEAKRQILRYARQHDHLPKTLSDLLPNADLTSTSDAWGRPLDYSFDQSGVVTLRSLGADKQPGGEGENRDMIGVFAAHDSHGNWQDENCAWMKDPFVR